MTRVIKTDANYIKTDTNTMKPVEEIIRDWTPQTAEERVAWDMYFCTIVGWQFHPGYTGQQTYTMDQCRFLANEMLLTRRKNQEEI